MAIEVKPKNIFSSDISRLNKNAVKSTEYSVKTLKTDFIKIADFNCTFFEEKFRSGYVFDLLENEIIEQGFSIIRNEDRIIAYSQEIYYLGDNDYDYATACDFIRESYIYGDYGYREIKEANPDTSLKIFKRTSDTQGASKSSEITQDKADIYETNIDDKFFTTKSSIVYYKYNEDGDLETFIDMLNTSQSPYIIVDLDNTTNEKLVFYVIVRLRTTNNGTIYYIVSQKSQFTMNAIIGTEDQNIKSGDYKINTNELLLDNTLYNEYDVDVTNKIIAQHHSPAVPYDILVGEIYVKSENDLPVATDISVIVKESGKWALKKYGQDPMYHTLIINAGQTQSEYYESTLIAPLEIVSISPYSDGTYIYAQPTKMLPQHIADKIVSNYQNGKVTMNLECSIDDYYDGEDNKVISKRGSDGLPMTFTNNDIVLPKRVVMAKSSQGDDYGHEEVDMVNGKQFRVVGVKVKYDGHITQELTLQEEKT